VEALVVELEGWATVQAWLDTTPTLHAEAADPEAWGASSEAQAGQRAMMAIVDKL
jgi:hypothetical protein